MKMISWNVNGLRAAMGKGFMEAFAALDADIFCLQETKLQQGQIEMDLPGYYQYWNYAEKKGYSGTAIFTRREPLSVRLGIGQDAFEFSDAAGTQTLSVKCNTDWKILGLSDLSGDDTSWLKLGQLSGNGNAEVPFTVDEYFDDAYRYALLIISAGDLGDNTYAITVRQNGKELITMSLDATEQTFTAAGGTKKVKVSSNGAWSAAIPTDISWVSITPTSGIGDGEITVTCDPNMGAAQERLTTLTVSAGSKNPKRSDVIITQTAN